jgi:hypothetical protein
MELIDCIRLIEVIVALWAGYEIGRSDECAEWCERQLRGDDE